jgi:hypothetical protein
MKEKKYQKMVNQEYLNARQLTVLSIIVLAIIQTIPIFLDPTPFTEWMLLGYTAGVSTCAIVGAILVQHNADKITLLYKRAFNEDFYETIDTLNEVRKTFEEEDADGELLKDLLGLMRAYLNAQANPLQPPTTEELGVSEPTPYYSEDELFS